MSKKEQKIPSSKIKNIELTMHVNTGNLIFKKFDTVEDMIDFVKSTANNPKKIRGIITPKRNKRKSVKKKIERNNNKTKETVR